MAFNRPHDSLGQWKPTWMCTPVSHRGLLLFKYNTLHLQIITYILPTFSQEPNPALFSVFYIDSSPRSTSSQPQEVLLGKPGTGMTSGTARWPLDVGFAHLFSFSDQGSELEIV